tara:strand:+ start:87 stop:794 length:708 start_codon:yes stop_codon:yes gene_type:complete
MSLKSLIQFIIIIIIVVILGGVYFNYFANYNKISIENTEQKVQTEIDTNLSLKKEIKKSTEVNTEIKDEKIKKLNNDVVEVKESVTTNKPEIDHIVKDIEYLTTDKNGNKYKILATSGRTNSEDNNILDLDNVRGVVTSVERSTVYIVSDFAEYNSSNLKSNFYQNVVINYEDKEITCDYFDLDMKTNIAIAYNNVVVTDPQSIMKAGKIILNIKTKVININPENKKKKVKITIN